MTSDEWALFNCEEGIHIFSTLSSSLIPPLPDLARDAVSVARSVGGNAML